MNQYSATLAVILTGSVAMVGARTLFKKGLLERAALTDAPFWQVGLVCGVISGALTLANPILGATTLPPPDQLHPGPGPTVYVQWGQFVIGLALCGLSGFFTSRRGQPSDQTMAAGIAAGVVGALVGMLINITALLIAPQAILNYYNALLGEAGPGASSSLALIPFFFYGLVALVSGAILGAEAGALGGALGRTMRKKA